MRFLLKLSILLLVFQVAFGKSYYQRQQEKKRAQAAADAKALRQLRLYCDIAENYDDVKCVNLRARDAAAEETRRLAAEKYASLQVFCETNAYDSKCIQQFGFPRPWNWMFYACLVVLPFMIGFDVLPLF